MGRSMSLRRHGPYRRQIRCPHVFLSKLGADPGKTYKVAEAIALREIHSELYSTSGDFDLLMKVYIPNKEDVGKYINDRLFGYNRYRTLDDHYDLQGILGFKTQTIS